jgi:hypothetical protein
MPDINRACGFGANRGSKRQMPLGSRECSNCVGDSKGLALDNRLLSAEAVEVVVVLDVVPNEPALVVPVPSWDLDSTAAPLRNSYQGFRKAAAAPFVPLIVALWIP